MDKNKNITIFAQTKGVAIHVLVYDYCFFSIIPAEAKINP